MTKTAHWQGRYKTEEIMEVGCPRCGARPHQFCDRSGEKLRGRSAALRAQGIPPSHQERMWTRQGHDLSELAALRAKTRPGKYRQSPRARGRRPPKSIRERDIQVVRCRCRLPAMPIRGVSRDGRDFTGWGCPAWACGFELRNFRAPGVS